MERANTTKELADSLHECIDPPGREERIERLACALQACFNEATRIGIREVQEVEKRLEARLDEQAETLRNLSDHLAKQDETLRLFWKEMGGNGQLPIDD